MIKNDDEKFVNVCHVTSAHSRYDIRIFHKECKSLANSGFNVTLLVNDNLPDELIDGVKIVSTKIKPRNRFERMVKTKKYLKSKMLLIDADVYHFHDPELLTFTKFFKKRGKKIIYDSHEDVPRQILSKTWIPLFIRKIISDLFERYENMISIIADGIIVPTPYILARFSKLNSNVCEVANFPLLREFDGLDIIEKREMAGCYIGGVTKNRGIFQISQAMMNCGIKLKICGKFLPEELEKSILEKYNSIEYLGIQDRDGVLKVLRESSFGFVTLLPTPNHINSYPIKMFEYMAAGIPVIASDFILWKEIVEGNNCGICVDPNSVEDITLAINYLKKNQESMIIMGMNGRKAVFENFNWESQASKIFKFYIDILK